MRVVRTQTSPPRSWASPTLGDPNAFPSIGEGRSTSIPRSGSSDSLTFSDSSNFDALSFGLASRVGPALVWFPRRSLCSSTQSAAVPRTRHPSDLGQDVPFPLPKNNAPFGPDRLFFRQIEAVVGCHSALPPSTGAENGTPRKIAAHEGPADGQNEICIFLPASAPRDSDELLRRLRCAPGAAPGRYLR